MAFQTHNGFTTEVLQVHVSNIHNQTKNTSIIKT